MSNYNIQFEKFCSTLKLGAVISEPSSICGGLLHKMYAVKTTRGNYAIKVLNPQIMIRPTAMQNFINSEKIANYLGAKIPALSALKINGDAIHCVDGQYYIVFNWVDGVSLKANEINLEHCRLIGSILADIHSTDYSTLGLRNELLFNDQMIDWNYYLQKGKSDNSLWINDLLKTIDNLYIWNDQAKEASKYLASSLVLSHRDLDSKNVLWNDGRPIIIDWECAGYINPMQDLIEVAVYWSENSNGKIEKNKFSAFLEGYKNNNGRLCDERKAALDTGYLSKLEWLEYSLKRSLRIECSDEEEQKLGTNQVSEAIKSIQNYATMIPLLEEWLAEDEVFYLY